MNPTIIVKNRQYIYDTTLEQRNALKGYLTVENPAYKNAVRYSRYDRKYITIPKTLCYYRDRFESVDGEVKQKVVSVPIGVNVEEVLGVPCDYVYGTVKKEVDLNYPKFELELRKEQILAEEAYLSCHKSGNKRPSIIQLPTGKGKSILALHLAYTLGVKTLILVHKNDLVVGWQKDIDLAFGGKVKAGLIKAKSRKVGEQITIATVQTLSRMSEEELSEYTDKFGLVVQDECLTGDTLVLKEDGGVIPITDVEDTVYGGKVSNKFSRKAQVYELVTSHSILRGSATHPCWCVPKGKKKYSMSDFEVIPLSELNGKYLVPVLYKIPHTEKVFVSEAEARFAAMVMCDGHLDASVTSNRIKVNVKKDVDFYRDIWSSALSSFKENKDCRGNTTFWVSDKQIKDYYVNHWGIPRGKKSDVISIPWFMYYAPLDTIKAFIETCFNCEGDLSVSRSCRINFSTCSYIFAQGLSYLLKKFGILSTLQHIQREKAGHNDVYRLSICGIFFNRFMEQFNLLPRKSTIERNVGAISSSRFVGDYYLDRVVSVKDTGREDIVYDFEVSESHSFIANGIYTHNCHHCAINMFNMVDNFKSHYKLGLSATPKRTDGLSCCFDFFFGGLCYKYEYVEDDEDISNVLVKVQDSKYSYNPFIHGGRVYNADDFSKEELPDDLIYLEQLPYEQRPKIAYTEVDSTVVKSKVYKSQVCKDIINEYKQGHSVIAMFKQKEHIDLYYAFLKQYIPMEQILLYYGDNRTDDEELLRRAESKEVLVTLATYAKATEGTNVKSWEVMFLVSSVNNEKDTEQAIGRIRRRKEGKLDPVLVYDYRVRGYTIGRHIDTRMKVYKNLKCKIEKQGVENARKLFSVGYN